MPRFADSNVPTQFPAMLTTGSLGAGVGEVGPELTGGSGLDALQPSVDIARMAQISSRPVRNALGIGDDRISSMSSLAQHLMHKSDRDRTFPDG